MNQTDIYNETNDKTRKECDCEISAADVARAEVFPKKKHASPSEPADPSYKWSSAQECGVRVNCTKRTDGKNRTRPTNPEYEMIDPDAGTADPGKS